jgi:hypothetical protein
VDAASVRRLDRRVRRPERAVENWFGWLLLILVWIVPLVVGLGLAVNALHRDRTQQLARTALVIHGVLITALVVPTLLDHLINLG